MDRLLARDLLLVCWDEDRGRPHGRSGTGLPAAVGGALLLDAVFDGALILRDGRVEATGQPATDALVAELVEDVTRRRRPPRPKALISSMRGSRRLRAVEQRMVDDGLLEVEERRLLGLFPLRRHRATARADHVDLRERIRRLLAGEQDPVHADDGDVILASLAGAAGLIEVLFPRLERKAAKQRAEAFRDGAGISEAVSDAIREAQAAVIAATAAAGAVAASG